MNSQQSKATASSAVRSHENPVDINYWDLPRWNLGRSCAAAARRGACAAALGIKVGAFCGDSHSTALLLSDYFKLVRKREEAQGSTVEMWKTLRPVTEGGGVQGESGYGGKAVDGMREVWKSVGIAHGCTGTRNSQCQRVFEI